MFLYLKGDDSHLNKTLDRAEGKAQSWAGKVGGFLGNAASFAVGGLLQSGISAVAGAVGTVTDSMIGGNAAFENYNQKFSVLLGSADEATKRMADLSEFGAKTPFELPQVVEADTILQGFGLHSEESAKKFGFAGEEIRTIAGDVASGTGAQFEEMSLLIGKFSAGATGEAISRMQELGITNRDELKKMGLEFDKSGSLLSPLPEAMNTILGLMQEKYGGMMEAQSTTFSGMMSNLQDWMGNAGRVIGKPIFNALKDNLSSLLTLINSPEVMKAIDDFAQTLASGIGKAIEIGKSFSSTFGEFGRILFGIGADTYDTNDAIREFLASLGFGSETINTIEGYLISLEGVLSTVRDAFGYLIDRIQGWGIGALFSAFEDGSSILGGFFERLGMSESTAEGFASVIFALKDGIIQLGTWVGQIASAVLPLLSQAFSFLMNNLSTILPILGAVVGVILAISSPVTALVGAIVLLATAWSNNWLGIQGVVSSAMAAIQPYLDQLSTLLNAFIIAILPPLQMAWQTLVQVWTGEVQPALAELWAALGELFTALGFGTGQTDVWSIAMGALKIILLGVIGVVQILTPAIRLGADVMTFMINQVKTAIDNFIAFKQGIDGVIATIRGLIDKVRELASSLVSLEIPDWLTPGSPTPFEMGLRGIAGAIDNLPELNIGANLAGANPVAAAAGGGGPSFGNISISVNGAGDPAAVGQAVRKEIEALFGQARR